MTYSMLALIVSGGGILLARVVSRRPAAGIGSRRARAIVGRAARALRSMVSPWTARPVLGRQAAAARLRRPAEGVRVPQKAVDVARFEQHELEAVVEPDARQRRLVVSGGEQWLELDDQRLLAHLGDALRHQLLRACFEPEAAGEKAARPRRELRRQQPVGFGGAIVELDLGRVRGLCEQRDASTRVRQRLHSELHALSAERRQSLVCARTRFSNTSTLRCRSVRAGLRLTTSRKSASARSKFCWSMASWASETSAFSR